MDSSRANVKRCVDVWSGRVQLGRATVAQVVEAHEVSPTGG